jgi:hypothetical protein
MRKISKVSQWQTTCHCEPLFFRGEAIPSFRRLPRCARSDKQLVIANPRFLGVKQSHHSKDGHAVLSVTNNLSLRNLRSLQGEAIPPHRRLPRFARSNNQLVIANPCSLGVKQSCLLPRKEQKTQSSICLSGDCVSFAVQSSDYFIGI